MSRKWKQAVVSFVLTAIMVIEMIPTTVFAESEHLRDVDFSRPETVTEMNAATEQEDTVLREPKKYDEEPEPEGTLVAVSEEAATYQQNDGTFTTQIGGETKAYQDENGELQLVDNTLVEQTPWFAADYFENKANDYSVKLPTEITEDRGVQFTKDGNTMELIPQGGDFSKPVAADNAVLYNDVFDGIDYQYTVMGDMIKEDIVLNKVVSQHTFAFRIEAGQLKLAEKDGAIIVYAEDVDSPIFTIVAPEMSDANGNISTKVTLSLDGNVATIDADAAWLEAPERGYPVRIDPTVNVTGSNVGLYGVEQTAGDMVIGDNNYPYCGYDDGVVSGNLEMYDTLHGMTRTYVKINYDFSQIPSEAKIENASLSVYHYTAWSRGKTNFGIYTVDRAWNPDSLTWNAQKSYAHTFVEYQKANASDGWLTWNVRKPVNDWVQGVAANHGFVIKAEDERNMQCEVFHNKNGTNKPKLTINWSIPDPVDPNYPLNDLSIALRPMTEKNVDGKLLFDAVFADGTATPNANVKYWLSPTDTKGNTTASVSYKYPDSTPFASTFPNATAYKDKLSNWQTQLFGGLSYDKAYRISATAAKDGKTSRQADSDKFLIYKIKRTDTFPYIANHYGVPLNTIMADNHVQDTLVIENNTIFIRNPKTEVAYNPAPLTDSAKKAIDSALMGRGKHCEYGFEPINLNTGNFYFNTTDAAIPDLGGDFAIERTYNSKVEGTNSLFGRNWSFAYSECLSECADGKVAYTVGDGKTLYFTPDGNGGYTAPFGYDYTLKKIAYTSGKNTFYRYELHSTDGSCKKFNAWGLLSDVVDGNGFITSIQYDKNYNIKSITSPSGKVYGITCADGRISEIKLPNGAVLQYTYDKNGDLTAYKDANGNTVRYVYDSQHRMTEWYDQENNRVVLNQYDADGRVIKQTDANGAVATLVYKPHQTTTTDGNGNVTVYTYDDHYRTTVIKYPDGKTEEHTYDADNNLTSDEDGTYTYDANGNQLTQTRKDGAVRSYTYDSYNRVTSVTDFDAAKTVMDYSAAGDLTKVTYADGTSESYTYDDSHRMLTHTNANGKMEKYSYDGAVATGYTDYNGNSYQFYYNAMNQLITKILPDGSTCRKMYDAAGVQVGEQAADGGYTEYSLNKIGNVIRMTDPMGYVSEFAYDGMSNIVKGTDSQGNTVIYTYDSNSNQTSQTDANGQVTKYGYDSRNRLVKETAADGSVLTYTYDTDGNLITKTDANGNKTVTDYDDVLKLPLKTTDPLGNVTAFTYSVTGKPEKITYADGTFVAYEYDLRGRITKFTDQTGLVSEFTYDGNGNVCKLVENGSRVYSYTYDNNNNLVKATDPLGGVVTYAYDSLNRQISTVNELGNKTGYQYDAVGRLTKITDAAEHAVQTAYDLNGNIIAVTDANGGVTQYAYDSVSTLISQKDDAGHITNYAYDGLQQLSSVTDALGGVTSYEYDKNGRVIAVTDANGDCSKVAYDANGNAVEVTLPNGDSATFVYDALDRVVTSTDAAGLKKNYTYDSMGRVTEVTDNTGAKLNYTYDSYGRLIKQTDVMGRSESYEYDAYSQIISVVGTDGNKTVFSYDDLGRLISYTDAEMKTTAFAYDAVGNLLSKTEADGAVYQYAYDTLNRVTECVDPIGAKTVYGYDKNGNLTAVTDGNGITNTYAYDTLNQLVSAVDGNGNATSYEYDELSRLIALTEPEGSKTEYRYDAVGNTTKVKDANGYITEFQYDSVGNAVKAISQRGAEISYTYDKHNILTSVTDALGYVTNYQVDLNGLTTKMVQPNGGEYTYTYDKVNRITGITTPNGYEKTFTYDSFGNLTREEDNADCVTSYEYDLMHRITKVTDPNGSASSYIYNEQGNLSSVIAANGAKTSYVYDMLDRVTEQSDPEGKVTALQYDLAGHVTSVTEQGGRTTKLSYDNNYNLVAITDPMGYVSTQTYDKNNRITETKNALGESVTYEYDPVGQVTKVTDASAAVVEYAYDAHGNITKVTNPLGGETKYSYDLADNLTKVTDQLLRETSYSYDSMGNLIGVTDAAGNKTSYTYDLEGNLTSLTDANGSVERMSYDLSGNLKNLVRPDGTSVSYDYDKLNKLVSKNYSADDTEVAYQYDESGNRTEMRDENGESSYAYDIMNRLTSVTSADGKAISYAYDTCGRLGTLTYADGRTVSYAYDLDDRLTSVEVDGETTAYDYDAIGRVVKTTRPDGSYTEYSYNSSGNLSELQNIGSDGSVVSAFAYTYDAQGYIVSEIAKTETEEVTRNYTYSPSGELTEFTESDGAQTAHYTYSYDSHGNRTKLVKSGIAQPETIEYTYNAANQLVSETSTIDGTTRYAYDDNGNLISKQGDGEKELTYEYTVEQRLKAVREGGELLMAASYDGDGNRVFQISRTEVEQVVQKDTPSDAENTPHKGDAANAGTAGSAPQSGADATPAPADDGTSLPNTDNAAQTTKTSWERDYVDPADSIFWYGFGQGVLQFFNTLNTALAADLSDWFCHAWDSVTGQYQLLLHSKAYSQDDYDAMRNAGLSDKDIAQIIGAPFETAGSSMSEPSGSNVSAAEKAAPNGTQSEAKSQPTSDTVVIPDDPNETTRIDYELTYYINDVNTEHTQVLMEYGKRDELKNVYTYGNERIAAETLVQAYSPDEDQYATDYYIYDGRGSVAQVLRADEIVQSYSYDPFGNVTSGAPQFVSFYGYNAEDTNPVTGLQYLRARYYDTATGRFDVADTYLGDISAPLTLNRYSYAVNNPVFYIDPSGHFILTALAIGAAIGGVIGAVSSGVRSYKNQKANGGTVNGWTVLRDAVVGGAIGAVAGAAAGVVGAVVATGVAAVAGAGLVATVIGGTAAAVAGGITNRAINTALSDAASNVIQRNNLYPSAVYTQQKTAKQVLDEAVGNAFDAKAMLGDAAMGAVLSLGAYGIQKVVASLKNVQKHSCGIDEHITKQNPVESATPEVPVVEETLEDIAKGKATVKDPYDLIKERGISQTLSEGEIQAAKQADLQMSAKQNPAKSETAVRTYGKADLTELSGTENFTDAAIEHIFEGQVNGRGKATGYHYNMVEETGGQIISGTETVKNEYGVYKGNVEVNGIPKKAESTFFPDDMSPQEVIDSINEAYANREFVRGNTYRGKTRSGLKIQMFLDESDKIISAFPIY